MWNRRDYLVLATAAFATFGLTVTAFWPRVANAVDDKPAPTANIKMPTLVMGTVNVTAQLDKEATHNVLLTVQNTADQQGSAAVIVEVQAESPSSEGSRTKSPSQSIWSNEYSLKLQPNECRTITIKLPDSVFTPAPAPANQRTTARTIPGRTFLTLSSKTPPQQRVMALNLTPTPTQPAEKTFVVAKGTP
jgi:hypothetical protein